MRRVRWGGGGGHGGVEGWGHGGVEGLGWPMGISQLSAKTDKTQLSLLFIL